MKQIVQGVYQVSKGVNSFVIDGDEGVVLVDTGLPKRHGAIIEGLSSIGRAIESVRAIVITHGHSDHTGGTAALKLQSDAAVIASAIDSPIVRGETAPPAPPVIDLPGLRLLAKLVPTPQGAQVDHEISDGEVPIASDLRAIPTPGHTPGHISLLLDREGGVLFAGDSAMVTRSGGIQRGFINRKTPTFDASLKAMAAEEFTTACFGHSSALTSGASGAFKAFVGQL